MNGKKNRNSNKVRSLTFKIIDMILGTEVYIFLHSRQRRIDRLGWPLVQFFNVKK